MGCMIRENEYSKMKISSRLGRLFGWPRGPDEAAPFEPLDHPDLKHLTPLELADLPWPSFRREHTEARAGASSAGDARREPASCCA